MYTDLYLKLADEAEADAVLYTVHPSELADDGVTMNDEYVTPNYANIDTLGILYVEQPDVPPVPEDGWFVNVRLVDGEDGSPLVPFEVHPVVPRRIWA